MLGRLHDTGIEDSQSATPLQLSSVNECQTIEMVPLNPTLSMEPINARFAALFSRGGRFRCHAVWLAPSPKQASSGKLLGLDMLGVSPQEAWRTGTAEAALRMIPCHPRDVVFRLTPIEPRSSQELADFRRERAFAFVNVYACSR